MKMYVIETETYEKLKKIKSRMFQPMDDDQRRDLANALDYLLGDFYLAESKEEINFF